MYCWNGQVSLVEMVERWFLSSATVYTWFEWSSPLPGMKNVFSCNFCNNQYIIYIIIYIIYYCVILDMFLDDTTLNMMWTSRLHAGFETDNLIWFVTSICHSLSGHPTVTVQLLEVAAQHVQLMFALRTLKTNRGWVRLIFLNLLECLGPKWVPLAQQLCAGLAQSATSTGNAIQRLGDVFVPKLEPKKPTFGFNVHHVSDLWVAPQLVVLTSLEKQIQKKKHHTVTTRSEGWKLD